MTIFNYLKKKFKRISTFLHLKVHQALETRMGDISDALRGAMIKLINIFKLLFLLSWFFIKYGIMYNVIGKDETEMMFEAFREEVYAIFFEKYPQLPRSFEELLIVIPSLSLMWSICLLFYRVTVYRWIAMGRKYAGEEGGYWASILAEIANTELIKSFIILCVLNFLSQVWDRYEKKKKRKNKTTGGISV